MHTQSIVLAPEVLPPDVNTRVAELQRLDGAEAQARAVTVMLSHARTGLLAAIASHDLPQIVEFKAKAAAIQEIAKQVRLGKDMQLDAAEFVRKAERGLGVAIREGQARGEVGGAGVAKSSKGTSLPSPYDFAAKHELQEKDGRPGIYAMADGVTDEQFEDALAEARAEGNLSRANVARKAKAKATEGDDGALTVSDIVRLGREVPVTPGGNHAKTVSAKYGIGLGSYKRIKQVVDASENDPNEDVREYAKWLAADLDAKRTTPNAAVCALEEFRKNIDADIAPNPANFRRPFKKTDTEMLAEIAGTLSDFAEIITWIRPGQIDQDDAEELTDRARKAIRVINSKLKEITK